MHTRYFAASLLLLGAAACGRTTKETRTETVTVVQKSAPSVSVSPALVAGTLSMGTKVTVMLQDSITSLGNHVGDVIPAVIEKDVKDADGRVLFPAGTAAQVRVAAVVPPTMHQDDAGFTLEFTDATISGRTFLVGPRVGTAAGAAVGGIISRSVRGAVVDGLLGGANDSAPRSVVVKQGTRVEFELQEPVTVLTS